MHAKCASLALDQHAEIAAGLCCLYHTERITLARNRKVVCIVAGNLQEDAGVWAAFISLPGGMQEAWTEAEAGGVRPGLANYVADALQLDFVLLIHFYVGKQGQV